VRYVELFAGAGGLSMGLEAAGMVPVAHAEIEPHARAVLRHHWPDTPLHGDVTQVDWTQYAGQVDLVAAGSPCQDLSVAGRRAGLAGARSGLFYELIRAWDEMGATYCLWENVDGARSSNGGKDFAAVLSAFVGAPVIVPRDGWASAGVVAGSSGVAAWRVLDLQHFGPPQRRRRIFVLAARTGGVDPAEVLALSEGVCGHPSPREHQRQGAARGAAGGAQDGGIIPIAEVTARQGKAYGAKSGGDRNGVLAFTTTQTPKVGGDVAHTLEAASRSGGGQTPAVLETHQEVIPTLGVCNFKPTKSTSGAQADLTIVQPAVLAHGHADVVGTLDFGGHGGSYNGQDAYTGRIFPSAGRPRRLTPKECERLMGWPDQHTAHGVKEDGTAYALSDTARYRLCGNGVGTPVAAWIADRLVILEATV
jgi:DNA (cytosine-5)-methyltransferase 1